MERIRDFHDYALYKFTFTFTFRTFTYNYRKWSNATENCHLSALNVFIDVS